LADDETGGHVDNVACFARPGVVLALAADDKADANAAGLAENQAVLRAATDARGRQIQVVPIQQPRARPRAGASAAVPPYPTSTSTSPTAGS
jgi:agmatine deiminase